MSAVEETKKTTPSGVALGKSRTQHIVNMMVNGQEAHVISGVPEAVAVSTRDGKVSLDLGAFGQVIELTPELAALDSIKVEFEVRVVPGPQ